MICPVARWHRTGILLRKLNDIDREALASPQKWAKKLCPKDADPSKLAIQVQTNPSIRGSSMIFRVTKKNLELKKAMENHHSFQYQVSSTNMLNMCMLRWSDSLEKSWFEVITYSHNCYHNSDLWRRAGLHNVCCLGKMEPSDHHPNIHQTKNHQTNHQQEVLWAWRADFFGVRNKKTKKFIQGQKLHVALMELGAQPAGGVSCAKIRSKVGWQQ